MKLIGYIGIVLMAVLAGCGDGLPRPAATPSQRGTASPQPSPGGEGVASLMLENIDSLMWVEADSALKVMLEFAGSEEADSLDEFEGHYCQVLVAELLFKNYYRQINRTEVLRAVGYFDSLVDIHGADTRGVSVPFIDARAHYINGAGYYERDSLIEACGEYLCALRIMESHFGENELVGKKARFMALTYNRLVDLFSEQYMQEPAIYCGKQALVYNRIAPTSPYGNSNILYRIGKQYDKLQIIDSAAYYYDMALELMPDRNNMIYRDIVSSRALFEFLFHNDTIAALDSLKSMAAQAVDEAERINRKMSIGSIYYTIGQYDSAKICLEPVVENDAIRGIFAANFLREIALSEGDTLKANEYAFVLAQEGAAAANNQAQVSRLNELFQSYMQEKQEAALALEQQKARRRNLWIGGGVALLAIVGLAVAIVTRRSHRKRLAAQEAEAQRRLDEASKRLSEASQRHDETERELQTKVEQAAQHTREVLEKRVMGIYMTGNGDRLQRIFEDFETVYPHAIEKLEARHPELTEQERNVVVLSFLRFRAKEMAELLGLTEGTVQKYRSNIRKKVGNDPISEVI